MPVFGGPPDDDEEDFAGAANPQPIAGGAQAGTPYTVGDVPAFLQPTTAQSTIARAPSNGKAIAQVNSTAPQVVQVREPGMFTKPDLTHEETHVYQFSRNPAVVNDMENAMLTGRNPKGYTYGGPQGLLQAQKQGKTIADFNPEQQAEMMKDFQTETQQAIAAGDPKRLDLANQAYGRYARQLANLPGRNASMTTMTQQDLTPAAPGLPPAAQTGMLIPNKLLGGPARIFKRGPR